MKVFLNSDMRRITLKQLRALTAVVENGTVSGAAQVLGVTPPAVTLQMRLLEETVGMPLVERTDQGLHPTDCGKELLAGARRIEATLADCGEALQALAGIERGQVTVGIISTAKYFAPRVIAAFVKAHPKVDLRLHIGNRGEIIAGLRNYDFDLAIMGRPPEDFDVERAVIGDHPHIIVGPADHPLVRKRRLELADLGGETFLLREDGSGTRLLMQHLFAQAGLSPNLGMEIGSNETIKQAVMAGLGIALISAHTVSAELRDGRLAAFDVAGLPIVRQWFVVTQKGKRLLPAGRALWEFISTSSVDYLPAIEPRQRSGNVTR
jgi:LysR family transcriptional regulator for metE and metH